MKPLKVLVVGAGVTGSLTSCLLKRAFNDQISVLVWDKSRGAGGRMSTSRMNRDSNLTLDLGAQYISASTDYALKHEKYYQELLDSNVIQPLKGEIEGMRNADDGTLHYVTPNGSSSIPKYFLEKAGNPLQASSHLQNIDIKENTITAHGISNDEEITSNTDVIILTLPVIQMLNLKGDIQKMLEPYRNKLKEVKYSSRYALGLFYPEINELPDITWSAKYVSDHPCLRYISIDTKKRQEATSNGVSLVVHTSIPFSMKHLEHSFNHVQPIIEDYLYKYLPSLPKHSSSKLLRWRYSQVTSSYDNQPGCLVINTSPLVILAGDGFTHSNFDGCVDSAEAVLEQMKQHLTNKI